MIEINPTYYIKREDIKWVEFSSIGVQLDMNNLFVVIGIKGGGQTSPIRITEDKMQHLTTL